MKRIFTILVAVLLTASVFAQTPEKMTYQAVVRDANDNLVTNTSIGMRISILKSSVTGLAIYVERQFPTTNTNGLVSIEIGTGTVIRGDFRTIDWANDTYFIKTETDLNGGAHYTITGTSQLLSVPYALHAKTAESIDYSNVTNTPDLSGIAINEQAIQDTAMQIRADIPTVTTYSVGDFAQGGIVFWVDETGQHGLVCAKADQNGGSSIRWHAGSYGYTRATGDGPFAGETNTAIIIAALVSIGDDTNDYAAQICNDLQITEGGKTYGDWYLPSKEELNLMYQNRAIINTTATNNGGLAFGGNTYWSSNDRGVDLASAQSFITGLQTSDSKGDSNYVRAVRAF